MKYTYHIVQSFDDSNDFIENRFKNKHCMLTWCILGRSDVAKEIFDEYINSGWKFIYFLKNIPENNKYDYIAVRKRGNDFKYTLTLNSFPDMTGIPKQLNNYIDIIQNF